MYSRVEGNVTPLSAKGACMETVDATGAVSMHGVEGRVVIVTGAGRGIGRGIAHHLGKGGARIVVAEWKPALMESTCAELGELGVEHIGVVCDIQQKTDI